MKKLFNLSTVLLTILLCIFCSNVYAEDTYTVVKSVEELKEAINANENVKLGSDMEISESIAITEKEIIFDLNGHTITGIDSAEDVNFSLFNIKKGNVTFRDSKGNGRVTLYAQTNRAWNNMSTIFEDNQGVLNIESGSYIHTGGSDMAYVVNIYGKTTLNVTGGTLNSPYTAIRIFMNTSGMAKIDVTGGNIDGTTSAIWCQAPNSIAGQKAEIYIKGGILGTINTAREANADVKLEISGGSVKNIKGEAGEITISGGTVTGEILLLTPTGGAVESAEAITGGTFAIYPDKYLSSEVYEEAFVIKNGVETYAIGKDAVIENALKADSNTELLIGADVEIDGVAVGVTIQAAIGKKVVINGVTLGDEPYVVKPTVSVEIEEVKDEKVEEPAIGALDSKETQEILNETIESIEDEEIKDILDNNHVKVELSIEKIDPKDNPEIEELSKEVNEKFEGLTLSTYFEINVELVNALNDDVLGNISELKKEIELKVLLPEELLNKEENIIRKYYLIRKHTVGNVVTYDKIPAELSKDGKSLTFKSSKFSEYVLAYEDVKEVVKPIEPVKPSNPVVNPETSDPISGVILLSLIATGGLALTIRYKKFN